MSKRDKLKDKRVIELICNEIKDSAVFPPKARKLGWIPKVLHGGPYDGLVVQWHERLDGLVWPTAAEFLSEEGQLVRFRPTYLAIYRAHRPYKKESEFFETQLNFTRIAKVDAPDAALLDDRNPQVAKVLEEEAWETGEGA